jgi:hypothetical protein
MIGVISETGNVYSFGAAAFIRRIAHFVQLNVVTFLVSCQVEFLLKTIFRSVFNPYLFWRVFMFYL